MPPEPSLTSSSSARRATLVGDQALHLPQGFQRPEIEVAPVDEGPQAFEQTGALRVVAAQGPRPDQRVAFPVAPVVLIVVLQRVEARHQGPAGAERAKPHVHPEHDPVLVAVTEHLHQLLSELG